MIDIQQIPHNVNIKLDYDHITHEWYIEFDGRAGGCENHILWSNNKCGQGLQALINETVDTYRWRFPEHG